MTGKRIPRFITTEEKSMVHNYAWALGSVRTINKIEWLRKDSLFNLCFENSTLPYYVTEKLWGAWHGYSLPIDYSNDPVYEAVARGSLIDYRGFRNKQSLYQYVR